MAPTNPAETPLYTLRDPSAKSDPVRRWALPERVFFACGACHILAYAFLERFPEAGYAPVWIKPESGLGNHVVLRRGAEAFDYHGHVPWPRLMAHFQRKNQDRWPGWAAEFIVLTQADLIAGLQSRRFEGLHLRGPSEFLRDPLPRARSWLSRFPPPSSPT